MVRVRTGVMQQPLVGYGRFIDIPATANGRCIAAHSRL
jgi:hypothetical protein